MKEILEVHARNLSKPFDKMWIGRFRSFIKFVQTNPETQKVLASFHEEKIHDHAAFMDASSTFTKELKGLLLCKGKNKVVAEYALRDIHKPIGISQYETKIIESLPEDFKGSLPTIEQIELELEEQI